MTPVVHCACGVALRRLGTCETCQAIEAEERRSAEVLLRVRRRVPAVYRWATLAANGDLERAMPSKGPISAVRSWMADRDGPPMVLIRGETHSYKSSLAGACVRHEIEAGRSAAFVLAVDMIPLQEKPSREQSEQHSHAVDALRRFRELAVIDDLAKVLGGASAESGMAAWRRGELCAAIHRRWQARAKTIITTTLRDRCAIPCDVCSERTRRTCVRCAGTGTLRGAPGIVELFGEDILARLTDPKSAIVLELQRRPAA